ncbi:MAG: S9 family peptidase [Gemmatimonadaceae bacterium]
MIYVSHDGPRTRIITLTALMTLMTLHPAISGAQSQDSAKPPVAARRPHVTHIHGYTRSDDYFWLRDRGDPAVTTYLESENGYTTADMRPTEALQKTLYDEMLGRIKQTDVSAPYRADGYLYYTRTEQGKQYPIYARKKAGSDVEQITLDQNELAKGHSFFALGAYRVSDDGNLLAFTADTTGYRQYALHVKDLRTGKMLPDMVARVGSVVWAPDNRTLFLTTEDAVTKRSDKFWRHTVGSEGSGASTLLYDEKDDIFDVEAYRSLDRKMIFLASSAKTMGDTRYLPTDNLNAPLTVVIPRSQGHEYSVDYDAGRLYIRTNKGAKDFRLVSAPIATPDEKNWKEVIPASAGVKLEDVSFFARHMVASERENGLEYLRVIDKQSGASHRIDTPEPVYTLQLGTNREYNTDTIQFVYNSLVSPTSTFEYDMGARKRTLLKQQDVPGYDPARYEARRVWVTARDGVKVPVALVFKRGTKLDGSAPMLLYAYGSYGASISPSFSSPRVSLLDRGMIFALASIRGGGELGEDWREGGRMMQKMNTFTDFIDVAQSMVSDRFTSSDRLVIQGGSAGGLLMGAVVNMRPDLFKAAVAQVPFVDVMNTMLDASLPLTTSEYLEWGNPNEKSAFDYMMRYSPYDNVKAQRYPAMLIEISLNDSQVPYWEGAKFAAKLRAMKTGDNTLLLKTNMGAGHGGASGRYDKLKEVAFDYAFMLRAVKASR